VLEHLLGDERHAVPAGEHEAPGQHALDPLGEVHDLRHVGQVVEAEPDRLRLEVRHFALELGAPVDLQVHHPHLMAVVDQRGRHALQAERLEPQEDFRVHQGAGVYQQDAHRRSLLLAGMPARRT
jgi:hypothetical protein